MRPRPGDLQRLRATWHPSTRPVALALDPQLRWAGLEVLRVVRGGLLDREGTVAFRATAVRGGRHEVLEEDSRFVRESGCWLYVSPVPGG